MVNAEREDETEQVVMKRDSRIIPLIHTEASARCQRRLQPANRFNGFPLEVTSTGCETVETVHDFEPSVYTGLKPGVNKK